MVSIMLTYICFHNYFLMVSHLIFNFLLLVLCSTQYLPLITFRIVMYSAVAIVNGRSGLCSETYLLRILSFFTSFYGYFTYYFYFFRGKYSMGVSRKSTTFVHLVTNIPWANWNVNWFIYILVTSLFIVAFCRWYS